MTKAAIYDPAQTRKVASQLETALIKAVEEALAAKRHVTGVIFWKNKEYRLEEDMNDIYDTWEVVQTIWQTEHVYRKESSRKYFKTVAGRMTRKVVGYYEHDTGQVLFFTD